MPKTVLELLAVRYPTAKRQTLRRMIQAGRVRVGGVLARTATQSVDDDVKLEVDERPDAKPAAPSRAASAKQRGLDVVFEDDDLLVVNKPAGLLTSTGPREKRPTLLATVTAHVEANAKDRRTRVGLIHRLDRDASGLLVFSKNDVAYRSLKQQFLKHTVERVYLAVVHGKPFPTTGRVQTHLVERGDGKVYSTDQHGKGEWALTDYQVLKSEAGRSLVLVKLETGRKHQIRVHLSEKGWPIVGDDMYKKEGAVAPRLMLAAVKLSLDHPRSEERITWEIAAPAEFPIGADAAAPPEPTRAELEKPDPKKMAKGKK